MRHLNPTVTLAFRNFHIFLKVVYHTPAKLWGIVDVTQRLTQEDTSWFHSVQRILKLHTNQQPTDPIGQRLPA